MTGAIAVGSLTEVRYAPEVTFGSPSYLPYRSLRNVTFGVNMQKEIYQSEERSPDRQRNDVRHGYRTISGGLQAEVDLAMLGEFIEAAMGGTWEGPSNPLSYSSVNVNAVDARLSISAGSFEGLGLQTGDVFKVSASSPIMGITDRLFVVASTSNQTIKVEDGPLPVLSSFSANVEKVSQRFSSGNIYRSFTFQRYMSDLGLYQQFVGVRLNSIRFSIPTSGLVTVDMDFIGRDAYSISPSTYSISHQRLPEPRRMVSVDAEIRIAGENIGYATALELTINNNLAGTQVIGQDIFKDILFGQRQEISGSMNLLLVDASAYERFITEETVELVVRLKDAGTLVPETSVMQFILPRIKYLGAEIDETPDTGIALQMSFVALAQGASTGALPISSVAPLISGVPSVGFVLTTSNGIWSGPSQPTSFLYQWQKDTGSGFANIVGATNASYTVPSGDALSTLRCIVTAINLAGAVAVNSNEVDIPEATILIANGAINPLLDFTRAQVGGDTVAAPQELG
jgi:hypothetical protein